MYHKSRKNGDIRAEIIRRFGTQADFAAAIGSDESVISRILCGRRKLGEEEVPKWSGFLGFQPERLKALLG